MSPHPASTTTDNDDALVMTFHLTLCQQYRRTFTTSKTKWDLILVHCLRNILCTVTFTIKRSINQLF